MTTDRLFVKNGIARRATKITDNFVKHLDLSKAKFDEGWSIDRPGKPQYTLATLPYNLVAVHTETLKGLKNGQVGNSDKNRGGSHKRT